MAKSTEIGRAGADRVTRSLSGISSGGILVTAWWKILDPGAAPWSRGNYEIFSLLAPNWLIRGIVGNATVDAAGIGALNCNTMLFTGSAYSYTDYIGDFSFYSGGAGGLTQAQLKDWNWVAWWIQPGATFTMRQWLRVSGSGGVFLATDGGTDVSTDARLASATDPPTDLTWATNYDVPQSNGYLWHPTVRAQATSPTLAQLDALALATAPDATAWADWPFEAPSGVLNHNDQSGNGRTLSDASPGTTTFYEGPDSPAPQLDNVYMGASAVAYSATNPTPDYSSLPSPIAANDLILLVVGQKPSVANSGTVTTPTGYTLLTSLTGAGGYGATLGADTGNTNIFVYQKTSVSGTESGTITVTTGTNNVAFAYFVHFRSSNGLYDVATATTSQTTGGNVSLAFGAINVAALDWLLAAMVIPTDVTTPSQFSVEAFAGTGLTMGPTVELNEPDSTTNNDIGGVTCAGPVTAASGSTAVTLTATAGGTTTNVRGPGVLVRVRRGTSGGASDQPRVQRRPPEDATEEPPRRRRLWVPPPIVAAQPFRRPRLPEDPTDELRVRRLFVPIVAAPTVDNPPARFRARAEVPTDDDTRARRRLAPIATAAAVDNPPPRARARLTEAADDDLRARRLAAPIAVAVTPDNPPPRASSTLARRLVDESLEQPDPRARKLSAAPRGSMVFTADTSTGAVDLTAVGTSDWRTWAGTGIPADVVRKTSGANQISDWSAFGAGSTSWTAGVEPNAVLWSDGNPTAVGSHAGVLRVTGASEGFYWTAPADLTSRTVHLYLDKLAGGSFVRFAAFLSDSSADDLRVDDFTDGEWNLHLTYQAAAPGQTLTLYFIGFGASTEMRVRALALAGALIPGNVPFRRRLLVEDVAEELRAPRRLAPIPASVVADNPPPRSVRRREEEPDAIVGRRVRKIVPPPPVAPDSPPPRAGRLNWRVSWESWEPVEFLRKVWRLVFPGVVSPTLTPPFVAVFDTVDLTVEVDDIALTLSVDNVTLTLDEE